MTKHHYLYKVVYRLEKKGLSNDDKVQLLLPNNQNKILFDFQITNRNELRLKLTKEDSSSLRLTVVLPKTVTCDRESFTVSIFTLLLLFRNNIAEL